MLYYRKSDTWPKTIMKHAFLLLRFPKISGEGREELVAHLLAWEEPFLLPEGRPERAQWKEGWAAVSPGPAAAC